MVTSTVDSAVGALYSEHVNPQWVRLLDLLEMNVRYERCSGSELFTADGRRILDFLSGYCVHNVGHNHPAVIAALREELEQNGPAMVQTHVAERAGELAEKLCRRAGGRLTKVFFGSSGSEGVEAAIKFSRAHTGRPGLLYANGAFHGLTCGALSLMGDSFWREGFGPLLPETEAIPFDEVNALERKLASKRFAAFIVEPIQSEAGIQVPTSAYLQAAQSLCRRYGTLLVLDEVQTGMYRTGPFLAAQRFGVDADMVVLAKAMSGGLVPVSAVLMTDAIYDSVYGSLRRAIIHTSTFSENSLAMRAALATLEVLETEKLGLRAIEAGEKLRTGLQEALRGYEMVKAVRGEGLLLGVEFTAPGSLRLRVAFEAFMHIHPAMFGQIVVMRLFRDSGILTQICGNNFMVLKVAPPLVVTDDQIDEFVSALKAVVELAHSSSAFWSEALGLARRAIHI
ncbi:MAG TPA: aspartate aminotransferase family protein [Terriglobales bacterium]|nr:aspartate aminotransferase family protein [Terriglobales bacterium]